MRIDVTDDLAQRYLELGAWYEELEDVENAIKVYRYLLARAPALVVAEKRLRELEEQ